MKKQLFFLFHEKENYMHLKLIKTYVNRFIIDEDAECEVMEAYELTKPPEFEFSENGLIRKFQYLLSYRKLMIFCHLFTAMEKAYDVLVTNKLIKDPNFQMHCIFGLSVEFDLLFYFTSAAIPSHWSLLWNRSINYLSEQDLRSIPKHGLGKHHFTNSLIDSNVTIGDDIDFFIEKFPGIKSNQYIWEYLLHETLISNKLSNFLVNNKEFSQKFDYLCFLKESEDSYMQIECQRKFIPRNIHQIRSFFVFFVLAIFNMVGLLLAPNFYRPIIKQIFNVVEDWFNRSPQITFLLFWMSRVVDLGVQYKCFLSFLKFFNNFTVLMFSLLFLGLNSPNSDFNSPNAWIRIVHIVNLVLSIFYLWVFYRILSDFINDQ